MKINWFTVVSGIILTVGGIANTIFNPGTPSEVEMIMTVGGLIILAIGMKE